MKHMSVSLSDKLQRWFDSFSQAAAADMCMGGDDAECVAETCMCCLSAYNRELDAELTEVIKMHGYDAVFRTVCNCVHTL